MDNNILIYQAKIFEEIFGNYATPLPTNDNNKKEKDK